MLNNVPITFDEYNDSEYLEVDVNRYTTKGGEEIVMICRYGHD